MKNNGILLKIGTYVIGIVFTAGCVYAAVHYRLNTVEGNIVEIKTVELPAIESDIESCEAWMGETGKELVGIKKDVGYLRKEFDDSRLEQKAFRAEQRIMQKEILTEIKEIRK